MAGWSQLGRLTLSRLSFVLKFVLTITYNYSHTIIRVTHVAITTRSVSIVAMYIYRHGPSCAHRCTVLSLLNSPLSLSVAAYAGTADTADQNEPHSHTHHHSKHKEGHSHIHTQAVHASRVFRTTLAEADTIIVLNVRDHKCTNNSKIEQREQPAVTEEWGVAAASIPATPIPQPGTGPEDADEHECNSSHNGGYICCHEHMEIHHCNG